MALTDVVFAAGNSAAVARGDVGAVLDTTANVSRLFITLPAASSVENSVVFGHQGDEFTGSFVGGGGGGNTYSRGRIVNA